MYSDNGVFDSGVLNGVRWKNIVPWRLLKIKLLYLDQRCFIMVFLVSLDMFQMVWREWFGCEVSAVVVWLI